MADWGGAEKGSVRGWQGGEDEKSVVELGEMVDTVEYWGP